MPFQFLNWMMICWAKIGTGFQREILAMLLIPGKTGMAALGPIVKIPEDAELKNCGAGGDRRTVKIEWNGDFYLVFLLRP